jgi:hypothetical protein
MTVDEIFREDSPALAGWIDRFEQEIQESPDVYALAFVNLGEAATPANQRLDSQDFQETKKGRQAELVRQAEVIAPLLEEEIDPDSLIKAFFGSRLDRHVEFDADTQAEIDSDEVYLNLVAVAAGKTSYESHTGMTKTVVRLNIEAPAARDASRRRFLSIYLKRVMNSRAQNKQDSVAVVTLLQQDALVESRSAPDNLEQSA